jgi:medium-chain acyl-[acyl-carrier-protein] hydrolase
VRARLLCFPHAGGGAAPFYRWSSWLPPDVQLLPVNLPGRESRLREPAMDLLPPLVEAIGEAVEPRLDGPFAVLGHSMGAMLTFELARRWRRQGKRMPICLLLAACPAPQLPQKLAPIHRLPDGEFLNKLQARYQGIPQEVASQKELMRLLLPTLRADFKLVETYEYQPEPPLDCPILALAGDEDQHVTPAEVSAWREQTTGAFSLRILPGGHFFVHDAPASVVPILVRHLDSLLPHR